MVQVPQRVKAARESAGLTQAELARLAGVSQPKLSAYERGGIEPKPETVERIIRATKPRPSVLLERHADVIRDLAQQHHISEVRVFGSAVHGTDSLESDVDLLVTFDPDASIFDMNGFAHSVEELLGYPVDVVSDAVPDNRAMRRIRAEAVLL